MKRYLLAVIALLIIGTGIYGYHWVNSEATTSVSVRPIQPTNSVLGSETRLKPWQTDAFSTQVPTWLRQVSANDSASDPLAGSYVVSGGRAKDAQVAVTIAGLGNNTLAETAAVRLRAGNVEEYQPAQVSQAPTGAIAFRHIGRYETAVFWEYENHYVAVVASGSTSQQPDLQTALDSILGNWRWSGQ